MVGVLVNILSHGVQLGFSVMLESIVHKYEENWMDSGKNIIYIILSFSIYRQPYDNRKIIHRDLLYNFKYALGNCHIRYKTFTKKKEKIPKTCCLLEFNLF